MKKYRSVLKAVIVAVLQNKQKRRAFSQEKLVRLLSVAGLNRTLYLSATYTGLRLSELLKLLWTMCL